MKLRQVLRKGDKSYRVLEHENKIKIEAVPSGVIDNSMIEIKWFESVAGYELFKDDLKPEKVLRTGAFRKVPAM